MTAKTGKARQKAKGASQPFPGIKIRQRLNGSSGSSSWRVEVGARVTGDKRIIRQFPTEEEAKTYAQGMHGQRENHGVRGFALSDDQRVDAVQALEVLAPFGVNLKEAAEFYAKHAKPPAGDRTVSEVVAELLDFKETRQKARPRYLMDLKSRLGRFAATFGERMIKDVRSDEIEEWLFSDKALGDLSRDNYRRALGVLFSFAQGRRSGKQFTGRAYLTANPMEGVHLSDIEKPSPKILTVAESEALLNHAVKAEAEKGMLAFITLGLFCGLRTSELLQISWSHVRLDGADSFVTVPAGIAKKRRIRNVELPENARAWLALAKRETSGAIAPPNAAKRLPAIGRKAGINPWPSNCMRHSFGSYDFARHGNASLTSGKLGHRGDEILFEHYRSLTSRKEGERFFHVYPPGASCPLPAQRLAPVLQFQAAQ